MFAYGINPSERNKKSPKKDFAQQKIFSDKEEFGVKQSNNALRCCKPKAETTTRGMAQLVARLSGGQEVVSSSLATPTTSRQGDVENG